MQTVGQTRLALFNSSQHTTQHVMKEERMGQDVDQEERERMGAAAPDTVEGFFVEESFEEAQQRSIEESQSFAKAKYLRLDKLGIYPLRICPIPLNADGTPSRKGYEYPFHTMLLKMDKPSGKNDGKPVYASVTRATECGFSVDLIDTYRKLAVAKAKENNDDKLAEKIAGGNFGGGLKFDYKHGMYVIDPDNRGEGFQVLLLSHSQFRDLDDLKLSTWNKLLRNNENQPCPISSAYNAYIVEIEKKKGEGGKIKYVTSIDTIGKPDRMKKDELTALIKAPRLPEILMRYNRYSFGATLEFLKQYDAKNGFTIMQSAEMAEAIAKVESELSKDDTSSFSLEGKDKDGGPEKNANEGLKFEDLLSALEALENDGLSDKSEEGQALRGMIREFIEQENLSTSIKRSLSNSDLIDLIEDEIHQSKNPESKKVDQEDEGGNEADTEENQSDEKEEEDGQDTQDEQSATTTERTRSRRDERSDDHNEPAVRQRERPRARR